MNEKCDLNVREFFFQVHPEECKEKVKTMIDDFLRLSLQQHPKVDIYDYPTGAGFVQQLEYGFGTAFRGFDLKKIRTDEQLFELVKKKILDSFVNIKNLIDSDFISINSMGIDDIKSLNGETNCGTF